MVREADSEDRERIAEEVITTLGEMGDRLMILGLSAIVHEFPETAGAITRAATAATPHLSEELVARLVGAAKPQAESIVYEAVKNHPDRAREIQKVASFVAWERASSIAHATSNAVHGSNNEPSVTATLNSLSTPSLVSTPSRISTPTPISAPFSLADATRAASSGSMSPPTPVAAQIPGNVFGGILGNFGYGNAFAYGYGNGRGSATSVVVVNNDGYVIIVKIGPGGVVVIVNKKGGPPPIDDYAHPGKGKGRGRGRGHAWGRRW